MVKAVSPLSGEFKKILTPEALSFVGRLQEKFGARREELLARRVKRQADLDNGKIKRMWGAYGEPPTDDNLGPYDPTAPAAKQFRNPMHCAEMSNDGLVYTCDRPNDRVQVFTKEGKFVQEYFIEKQTRSDGSVWDIAFSKDPGQTYLYMADGANEHVRIYDRKTMTELYSFGYGGRQPGMFLGVHSIAVDSKGNLYTTETYTGKRLQKFVMKGLAPIGKSATPPWPGM